MYTLTLKVETQGKLLEQCLATEACAWDRSSCAITRTGDALDIVVQAKDATALKATAFSMIQLLSVFETMRKATNHDRQRN